MKKENKTYGANFKEIFNKEVESGELVYDEEKVVSEEEAMNAVLALAVKKGMIKRQKKIK